MSSEKDKQLGCRKGDRRSERGGGGTAGTRGRRERKITDGEHSGSLYTLNCCTTTTFQREERETRKCRNFGSMKKPWSTTCSACAT